MAESQTFSAGTVRKSFASRRRSIRSAVALSAAAAAVGVFVPHDADAATFTWARGVANTSPGYSWINSTTFGSTTNGNNWNATPTGAFPNAIGDIANLTPSASGGAELINLDQNITVGVMTLGSGNNSTGTITLASSGPTNPQAFVLTFNNNASDATITHNTTSATATITAPIAIAGDGVLKLTNSNTSTTTTFLNINGGITSTLSSGTQTLTSAGGLINIGGMIGNGATGGTMAVTTSAGVLTLGAANTYSGGTTIGGGAILASNSSSLGSGAVSISAVSGAQLQLGSGVNIGNALTINGGGAVSQGAVWIPTSNANATYSGNITINGNSNSGGHFAANGGTLTLSGAITSSVPVTVRTGTVLFTNTGSSYSAMTVNAGTAKVGAINAIPTGATVDLGASGAATFDLNGFNQTLAGVTKNASAATVTNSGGADATLSLTGSPTFAGVIQNGATNKTGLTINGGSVTLNGANTYTGNTNVSAGSLAFATSSSNIGALTLADNTSLSVKQAAAGTTLLAATAMTLGSSGATTLNLDFNNLNPTVAPIATGALTANGTIGVNLTNTGALTNGIYPLISYSSYVGSGTFPSSTYTLSARSSGTISNSGSAIVLSVAGDTPAWTGADSGSWVVGATGANHNWKLINAGTTTDYIEGDTVVFNDAATGATAIDISAANVTPFSTMFNNSSKSYTLGSSGGFGVAGTGSLTKSGTGSLTINTANTYSGGTSFTGGTLVIGSATALGTGNVVIGTGLAKTLDTSAATVMTANNTQSWNDDFTFAGSNTLDMGTGNVTLGGTGGRTVTVNNSSTLSIGKLIDGGTHDLTVAGNGTLNVGSLGVGTGGSTVNGTLTVSAGATLQINRTGAVSASTGDFAVGAVAGTGTITNGGGVERWLFVTNTAADTFAGTLANGAGGGALGLNKNGAGTLTLTGSNSYTGATTVNAGNLVLSTSNTGAGTGTTINGGTLTIANSNALGTTANIQFPNASTGTLDIQLDFGSDVVYTAGTNTTSNITIQSDVLAPGPGVTHSLGTLNLGGGSIAVKAGPNVSGGAAAISSAAVTLSAGSTQTTTFNPTTATLTLGAVSNINGNTHTLGLDGTNTGNAVTGGISNATGVINVAKSNTSTWTLSGASTYTGSTSISGGTLVAANPQALGSTTTITMSGTTGVLDWATDGTEAAYASTFGTGTVFTIVSDRPSPGPGINHTMGTASYGGGTVNLVAGANVTSGTSSVSFPTVGLTSGTAGSTLLFNPTTTIATIGNASITLNANAKNLALDGTSTGNTVTGVISDGIAGAVLGLVKSNSSEWTLSGASTYSGNTTVNGGTLTVDTAGSLASANYTVAPTATLNVNGAIPTTANVTANGTVNFAGNTTATAVDRNIGTLTIGPGGVAAIAASTFPFTPTTLRMAAIPTFADNTAKLDLTNNAAIAPGTAANALAAIQAGNIVSSQPADTSKAIGYIDLNGADAGKFEVRYTLKGDATLDGTVDVGDLGALATSYGITGGMSWANGDFNQDGNVNVGDLGALATNYGTHLVSGSSADSSAAAVAAPMAQATGGAAVPEPTSLAIIALGALGLTARRTRRR